MSYIARITALEFVLNNTPHINGETTMKCVARAIKEVPTADVVEVVRCKDCIFASVEDGKIKCYNTYGLLVTKETEYCSRGRRSENGT